MRAAMPLPPAGAAVCGPPEAGQDQVSGRLAGWCKKTKQFNLLNAQFTELCCVLWAGRVHNQKMEILDFLDERISVVHGSLLVWPVMDLSPNKVLAAFTKWRPSRNRNREGLVNGWQSPRCTLVQLALPFSQPAGLITPTFRQLKQYLLRFCKHRREETELPELRTYKPL